MRDYFNRGGEICFLSPIDGDCLNMYDGEERQDGYLWIKVKLQANAGRKLEVNDTPAVYNGEYFEAEVPLGWERTTLVAKDASDPEASASIVVYRLKNCTGIARLSVDDNIRFLQDITDNKDIYTSIFDNEYLAVYKEAHDKYDISVQLNVLYEYSDNKYFSKSREYFNLSMMTDKFKEEWKANASWLRLSFHAKNEFPNKPYEHTNMTQITEDAKQIYREVIRFAGEETLCIDSTTIHWGECTPDGMRGMRNLGMKGVFGYFNLQENGETSVSYYYPTELVEHLHGRDFWMDTREDILCGKIDTVLNFYRNAKDAIAVLEAIKADYHIGGCLEMMIHEQYFYEDFALYIPEYKNIILEACKWAKENGYKPYFMADVMP